MKKSFLTTALLLSFAFSATVFTGCKKDKPVPTATETTVVEDNTAVAPVEIAPDEALTTNLTDATKDFQGVVATVKDGEITVSGEISRDRLPALMQSLHALNPKKINNNLTIK